MHQVFKFGGASIRNPAAIRQMEGIIQEHKNEKGLIIVVSAMGKTTNALEKVHKLWTQKDQKAAEDALEAIISEHRHIVSELNVTETKRFDAFVHELFGILDGSPKGNSNQHYDQIVSYGELFSSSLIHSYLKSEGHDCQWVDARNLIHTSDDHKEAVVHWDQTMEAIAGEFKTSKSMAVTQGFIGSHDGVTTTLGREGSDYTAAIFACGVQALNVSIWKDVPGVMSADPKLVPEAVLFEELPYHFAAEMTYYGAKVIHPKTIKPLENASIALHVRPFARPDEKGTIIHDCKPTSMAPAIIYKPDLCLFTFRLPDFEFVTDTQLHLIFSTLKKLNISIYVIQNSAITVSVAIDYDAEKIRSLVDALEGRFESHYNHGLTLLTIKNYDHDTIDRHTNSKEVLLEQRTRRNYRALVRL